MPQLEKDEINVDVDAPPAQEDGPGVLKHIGGSNDDTFNYKLIEDAHNALPAHEETSPRRKRQRKAIMTAMRGAQPRDEIAGMLATQLSTAHDAMIACFVRAYRDGATDEERARNLSLAAKLMRVYGQGVDVLDRHQRKKAEDDHAEHENDGNNQKQPKLLTYQPEIPLRCADPQREAMPLGTGQGEDPLQNARRRRRDRRAAW